MTRCDMTAKRNKPEALEAQPEEILAAQIAVLMEEIRLLSDCLLEMSGEIYAAPDFKKGKMAAMLWAKKIMTGERCYDRTPCMLKGRVRALLIEAGCSSLLRE